MKSNKPLLLLTVLFVSFCQLNAQKSYDDASSNPETAPKLTFDCAKADHSISATDLSNCKKLTLTGKGNYDNCSIVNAVVGVKVGDNQKEFSLKNNDLSKELISALTALKSGSKIEVSDIKIEIRSTKGDKILRKIDACSFVIK